MSAQKSLRWQGKALRKQHKLTQLTLIVFVSAVSVDDHMKSHVNEGPLSKLDRPVTGKGWPLGSSMKLQKPTQLTLTGFFSVLSMQYHKTSCVNESSYSAQKAILFVKRWLGGSSGEKDDPSCKGSETPPYLNVSQFPLRYHYEPNYVILF